MGLYDEQIKTRKENDEELVAEAFADIAGALLGKRLSAAVNDSQRAKDEMDRILRFYHCKSAELPDSITDPEQQLEYLLRPHGIMHRTVKLEKGWYRDAVGAMLGVRKDNGNVVAFLPMGISGYCFFDENEQRIKLNRKTEALFEGEAICFYKPLPLRSLKLSDIVKYTAELLAPSDFLSFAVATLAVTLLGLLTPKLNQLIFSDVIASAQLRPVLAMAVFLVCVSLSTLIITAAKELILTRISTKISISVTAATMMRILSLPSSFFRQYSAGELTSRSEYIQLLCDMLLSTILSVGLSSVFSLVYISQIFAYAPALVLPALCIIIVTVIFSTVSAFMQMKISEQELELSAKQSGLEYALISGVQKLKLTGSENRAFARWGKLFAKSAKLNYDPPTFIKINSVISTAITLAGGIIMYYMAVKSGVSVADYYAFNTAYGMLSGAFVSLSSIALAAAQVKPILKMIKPILEAAPEQTENKQVITKLSGGIELSNVSFRYDDSMPYVIDNISLKVKPGQYVAIVGTTGCGKSTLMRLLLGFETAQRGAIFFDGKDASKIDLRSRRSCVGVVLQDGKLFQGDIYSNIVISAPQLTLDEAWEVAELAGIADDIRKMPMGMHTVISEGGGGISGGQRQRLLIARAIAPKPEILLLDEATSALDNITQKKVSDSLAGLHCTRIVIAHRLSTIKQCDKIFVMDKGKIAEEGTYDELIEKNGLFAELVERQRLDK